MKKLFARIAGLLTFAVACCLPLFGQTPADHQAIVEIPFEFVRGEIVVQVNVDGHGPLSMLLDTGVNPSVVELKTAKQIGLELATQGGQGSGGGTGANLAYPTMLPVVQLGGLTATRVEALGMDLSKISSKLGRPIAGVLGYSLLKSRIVQIDYPRHTVRFYQVAPSYARDASLAKGTTLPFYYQDEIIATGVKVDGQPVKTNIDTGSNSLFQFTPAGVEKLGLAENVAHAHASSSVGFNGKLENREGTVSNVTVGTISVNQPTVVFFGKKMGMDEEPWDLRIGNEFLKDFVVTLDFQLGKITLTTP